MARAPRRARPEAAHERPGQTGAEAVAAGTAAGGLMLGALNADTVGASEPERPDVSSPNLRPDKENPEANGANQPSEHADPASMKGGMEVATAMGDEPAQPTQPNHVAPPGHGGAPAQLSHKEGPGTAPAHSPTAPPDGHPADSGAPTAPTAAAWTETPAQGDAPPMSSKTVPGPIGVAPLAPTDSDTSIDAQPGRIKDGPADIVTITPPQVSGVGTPDFESALQDIAPTGGSLHAGNASALDEMPLDTLTLDGADPLRPTEFVSNINANLSAMSSLPLSDASLQVPDRDVLPDTSIDEIGASVAEGLDTLSEVTPLPLSDANLQVPDPAVLPDTSIDEIGASVAKGLDTLSEVTPLPLSDDHLQVPDPAVLPDASVDEVGATVAEGLDTLSEVTPPPPSDDDLQLPDPAVLPDASVDEVGATVAEGLDTLSEVTAPPPSDADLQVPVPAVLPDASVDDVGASVEEGLDTLSEGTPPPPSDADLQVPDPAVLPDASVDEVGATVAEGLDTLSEGTPPPPSDADQQVPDPAVLPDASVDEVGASVAEGLEAGVQAAVPDTVPDLLDDGALIEIPLDGPFAATDLPETLLGAEHDALAADFLSEAFYADGMSDGAHIASASSLTDTVSESTMNLTGSEPVSTALIGQSISDSNDASYDTTALNVGGVFGTG